MTRRFLFAMSPLMLVLCSASQGQTSPAIQILDCGKMEFADIGAFSDSGEFAGRKWTVFVPCYLIRHPDGLLLWDTGISAGMLNPAANGTGGIRSSMSQSLTVGLSQVGVDVSDIDFIALSHMHPDHAGNANLFAGTATWLSNRSQYDQAFSDTAVNAGFDFDTYDKLESGPLKIVGDKYDVFGDGSVMILLTPGHTPGHQVLFVDLDQFGPVVLSGDLHILREGFEKHLVPNFNFDRSMTLASMERLNRFMSVHGAKLIIQHSIADHVGLPQAPAQLH